MVRAGACMDAATPEEETPTDGVGLSRSMRGAVEVEDIEVVDRADSLIVGWENEKWVKFVEIYRYHGMGDEPFEMVR